MEDVFVERIKELPKEIQEKYIAFFKASQLSKDGKDREADMVFEMTKDYRKLARITGGILFSSISPEKVLTLMGQ